MIQFIFTSLLIGCFIFYLLCKKKLDAIVFFKNNPIAEEKDNSRIKLADFLSVMQMNDTLCIDARADEYYRHGHIPKSMPAKYVTQSNKSDIQNAGRIIVYGNLTSQREIKNIVHKLRKYTDKDVVVYSGGWEEWKSCGLPVEATP